MKKHRNPCPECGRRGKPNNIGIYSCEHCLTWWTKPVTQDRIEIDPDKVIKTEPKMIKKGMELSDLFLWALGIGAVIQLIIQIILWP
jgi:ribosomal protein L37AE/L43A